LKENFEGSTSLLTNFIHTNALLIGDEVSILQSPASLQSSAASECVTRSQTTEETVEIALL